MAGTATARASSEPIVYIDHSDIREIRWMSSKQESDGS